MTTSNPTFGRFFMDLMPLWIFFFIMMAICGIMMIIAHDGNPAVEEAIADQTFKEAMAKAGYRFASYKIHLSARCERRDEKGPVACDPLPSRPGLKIYVEEF